MRIWTIYAIFGLGVLTPSCAANQPADDVDRQLSRGGPPLCSRSDLGEADIAIETCVQNRYPQGQGFGPETMPEEMKPRHPFVVTTVETPSGRFKYPLTVDVAVRRDGRVVADAEFGADRADVQTDADRQRQQIRSVIPLADQPLPRDAQGALLPGTYTFEYRTDDGQPVGTTTVEVPAPTDADADDRGQP